ncbi:TPA: hypothetical protein I9093_002910 [Clostridium perfringens]|nr:hypothetical protein [Clostridium perfringens]HAT4271181.1 hypothetical protein [Clostridium perfringens]
MSFDTLFNYKADNKLLSVKYKIVSYFDNILVCTYGYNENFDLIVQFYGYNTEPFHFLTDTQCLRFFRYNIGFLIKDNLDACIESIVDNNYLTGVDIESEDYIDLKVSASVNGILYYYNDEYKLDDYSIELFNEYVTGISPYFIEDIKKIRIVPFEYFKIPNGDSYISTSKKIETSSLCVNNAIIKKCFLKVEEMNLSYRFRESEYRVFRYSFYLFNGIDLNSCSNSGDVRNFYVLNLPLKFLISHSLYDIDNAIDSVLYNTNYLNKALLHFNKKFLRKNRVLMGTDNLTFDKNEFMESLSDFYIGTVEGTDMVKRWIEEEKLESTYNDLQKALIPDFGDCNVFDEEGFIRLCEFRFLPEFVD